MKILKAREDRAHIRYVYYAMQNIHFPFTEHKRYWISEYSKIEIPLPSLEEQRKILSQIDLLEWQIEESRTQIEELKVQIQSTVEELWS